MNTASINNPGPPIPPAPPAVVRPQRYHGLDFVRAAMMIMGVVLHTTLVYMPEGWIYTDPNSIDWSPLLVWLIHTFRMSAFFVMAGFFGAMLLQRRGLGDFLGHRFNRIGIPLVIGSLILYPLLSWSLGFAWTHAFMQPASNGGEIGSILASFQDMDFGADWLEFSPMHLWFLYDLLWFYAAAAILVPLLTSLGPVSRAMGVVVKAFATGPARFATPVLLIVASFLLMLGMDEPGVDTSDSWYPDWHLLLTYSLPFSVGWLMWHHRQVINELQRWCWLWLGLALPLLVMASFSVLAWHLTEEQDWVFVVAQLLSATACWLAIMALVGCSERLLQRERPLVRYLVDASYWIYLAHLPLTIFVPALFRYWDAPGLLKMILSITIMMIVLLASYHLLVRNTAIGLVLSGRRYPAWPFGRTSHPEPPPTE